MTGFVIQTTMALAMNRAFHECIEENRNPGRVGHRILTNNASGVGVKKFAPHTPAKHKKEHKADSAVIA